jgi:hypothetical protein
MNMVGVPCSSYEKCHVEGHILMMSFTNLTKYLVFFYDFAAVDIPKVEGYCLRATNL